MREQEPKLLPLSKELKEKKYKLEHRVQATAEKSMSFTCPKCRADLTMFFKKKLSITTGISEEILENGGLETLPTIVSAGKLILEVSGIKFDTGEIAKISNKMALDVVEKLRRIDLEENAKEKYKRELEELNDEIDKREEKIRDIEKRYEKLEAEHLEFKTKVMSNPALKGTLAQSELLGDLQANFPTQQKYFVDITKQGHGDYLWSSIQINMGKWVDSGVGAIIDSKDKRKITEGDINKLKQDMKFHKKNIGIIIARKQEQLRLKEQPCGIEVCQEGYLFVTSRENQDHHIVLRFVKDVLARKIYESKGKQKALDTSKLKTLLNDIMKAKEYHRKIKSKASGIIKDVDSEEAYLDSKIQEAWEILEGYDSKSQE